MQKKPALCFIDRVRWGSLNEVDRLQNRREKKSDSNFDYDIIRVINTFDCFLSRGLYLQAQITFHSDSLGVTERAARSKKIMIACCKVEVVEISHFRYIR